jgi:hypothetical protein
MSFSLFDLVPAIYRLRDGQLAATMQLLTPAEQTDLNNLQTSSTPLNAEEQALLAALIDKSTRGPLQSLLMIIDEQLKYFSADLDQLYNDQFIETCAPWVIPYIGELIGFEPIKGIAPAVDDPRSEVGNTIALRRRKGTVLALEQLARDVTGWGAHASEFFLTLGATQYVKCVRLHSYYAPSVRSWRPAAFAKTGFSTMPRTVDVHNPSSPGLPRYNLPNIGIFLWSLQAFGITGGNPVQASTSSGFVPGCYRFASLGYDMPLFHAAISQGEQIMTAATEINVPDFLTRPELCADMRKGAGSSYYGSGSSLSLLLNGQLLNPYQIQVCDLSGDDGSWNNLPTAGTLYAAAIDPQLGRVALVPPAIDQSQTLTVSYNYGFNGAMGGGEYEREDTFQVTNTDAVFQYSSPSSNPNYSTLQKAITYVAQQAGTLGKVALEIQSSETFKLPFGPLVVDVPDGTLIEIRAADGARPTILLDGEIQASGGPLSTLIINGLLIAAAPTMTPSGSEALLVLPATRPNGKDNELPTLEILHATLVPGWTLDTQGHPTQEDAPAIIAHTNGGEISLELSIVGPIRAPELLTVTLDSSILDATDSQFIAYDALAGSGTGGGAPLTLTGCTVVGRVHAQELALVSNSILWAHVNGQLTGLNSGLIADRQQAGCVRFSFIPVNAITPKRFQCVEQSLAGPAPIFLSFRYGQPDYLKLIASTPDQVRRGADDEGEMGAFHFLLAPLREQDLEIRLEEFTPVGLNTGLVYQT